MDVRVMMDKALEQAAIAVQNQTNQTTNQTKMATAAEIAALAFAKLVDILDQYLNHGRPMP